MGIIITIIQAALLFLAVAVLFYTVVKFVMPSSTKGTIYLLRNAHNVDVNNSKYMSTSSMSGESTDGWGASHIHVNEKITFKEHVNDFFKSRRKTRVNTFGAQSRPHGYGWSPSV